MYLAFFVEKICLTKDIANIWNNKNVTSFYHQPDVEYLILVDCDVQHHAYFDYETNVDYDYYSYYFGETHVDHPYTPPITRSTTTYPKQPAPTSCVTALYYSNLISGKPDSIYRFVLFYASIRLFCKSMN